MKLTKKIFEKLPPPVPGSANRIAQIDGQIDKLRQMKDRYTDRIEQTNAKMAQMRDKLDNMEGGDAYDRLRDQINTIRDNVQPYVKKEREIQDKINSLIDSKKKLKGEK